jgi:hypothetical protein
MASIPGELEVASLNEDIKGPAEEDVDVSMSGPPQDPAAEEVDPNAETTVLDTSVTMEDGSVLEKQSELAPIVSGSVSPAIRTVGEIPEQDNYANGALCVHFATQSQSAQLMIRRQDSLLMTQDAYVKPEEDLVSASSALLSTPIPTDGTRDLLNQSDDLAMQIDSRNLKSEAEPPTVPHIGDEMAVDQPRTTEPDTSDDFLNNGPPGEMGSALASSVLMGFSKTEPEEQTEMLPAIPEGFQFESTGKYECRLILSGHTLSISALKFSPDGSMLASSGPCSRFLYRSHYSCVDRSKPRTRP